MTKLSEDFKQCNICLKDKSGTSFPKRSSKCHSCITATYKAKVINHYGGKCYCCDEATLAFLTLDHTNDDGAKHRKELDKHGKGKHLYKWLIRVGFKTEYELRVACYNCNMGRKANKICPHKEQNG